MPNFCPCGKEWDGTAVNPYSLETWKYNTDKHVVELVYAVCQHGKIVVNKVKLTREGGDHGMQH